jgi:hypothetical protein
MSDAIASGSALGNSAHNVTEAYAFACMHCGFGWEQAYEIEHHVDASGRPFVTYLADGAKVPSPLTRPACLNCGGQHVRIMRSGQVSDLASTWAAPSGERGVRRPRHWSVLHFLRRRRRRGTDTA